MAQFFLQIGSCPVSSATVMEEERYAEALDTLVVACVDIAVLHKKSILLGRRSRYPYPDWWILGGRIFRGEFFEDSARRILRREGNLVIEDKARFRRIGLANFLWKERAQLPAENGSQQISITMLVKVDDGEVSQIEPDDEYTEFRWVPVRDIKDGEFHEYVKECAASVEYLDLEK